MKNERTRGRGEERGWGTSGRIEGREENEEEHFDVGRSVEGKI